MDVKARKRSATELPRRRTSNKGCGGREASPEDGQLLLRPSRLFLLLAGLLRHELHMRIGELHPRFRHDLLVNPFHEARPVAALREDGAEVEERQLDRRRAERPSDLGFLGHVVREVRELVFGSEVRAVLPHHRPDGLLGDFQDQSFRELHVALVGHVDDDLIPDEWRVLRVVEDVRLDDEAVRDRDVPAGETVPVEDAPELAERRVHRGDFDDVPAGVVQLDAVAELVETHDRDDHPTDDVEERLLHDEDEGAEEDPGPDRSELRCAAAERDEEDEGEGGRPHDVGDDLEVGEDVRLVLHVGAKGRPEDGPEQLEERLRGDQDWDDDDPRTELVEVARVPGREACDLEDAPEEQQRHDHDDREGKPEEGSRFPPIGGSHRPCPAVRGLFKAGVEVISPERPARTAAFQPKLFMGPRWAPRRGGNLTAEPVIDVRGLTKHYADIKAVDGISFEVEKGQMFALLGPNGAGKTTTVEILEGLRDPTSGEARVLGVDVRKGYGKIRNRVGVLPQDFEPFDRLKPREAVAYWAHLFDRTLTKEEVTGLIRTVGLADRSGVPGGPDCSARPRPFNRPRGGGRRRALGGAGPGSRGGTAGRRCRRPGPAGERHAPHARETGLDRHAAERDLHEAREPRGRLPEPGRRPHAGGGARGMNRVLADMKAFGTQYIRSRVGTFFALVFPILLILLFGAIFGSSGSSQVTLYVQDQDNQPASHAFTDALNKTNVLTIRAIPPSADFSQYIRDHSINVALQIPLGFQDALAKAENGTRATVNLTLAGDQTQSSYGIAVSAVDAVATAFNLQVAKAAPVVNILPTSVPGLRHLTYIDLFLPGIIGFTILSTPLFGMTAICAEYRSRRYFKLLATTKLSKAQWLDRKSTRLNSSHITISY